MEVLSRKQRALTSAERWRRQYLLPGSSYLHCQHKNAVYERLCALVDPTPDSVDEAIGNRSWTALECNECRASVEIAVQLGDEPDYESCTAVVCVSCLRDALRLAEPDKEVER